ncbi:F-box protein [Musa troglodytarum]|uniref:F-box protein n=1 Tax=Musa troglodytarum TaxID=320322 RepID=A0A9E7K7D8_9LILI|nr:F-box protein [Musa troglodytarum]
MDQRSDKKQRRHRQKMEAVKSLDDMPCDVVSKVLAFTTPADAGRSSAVSRLFRAASSWDWMWEQFLPSDIDEILPRAVTPIEFSSKKELLFRLCDPILIDGGNKEDHRLAWTLELQSFALERSTGRKCLMVSSRELWFTWGGDNRYWTFTSDYESRFAEVAQLLQVCWLDLGGEITSTMLSPKTCYAAYFIFQLKENSEGFQSPAQEASISIGAHVSETTVILEPGRRRRTTDPTIQIPRTRDDGWMEIEMGEFPNDDCKESVRFRFRQVTQMNWKRGLIVQGIEFRPKN